MSPVEYTDLTRRASKYGESWRELIKNILEENGLKPRVEIKRAGAGNELSLAESIFWKNGDTYYLCVVKNPGNYGGDITFGEGKLQGLEGIAPSADIELNFNVPVRKMKNIRTGKDMGTGTKFADSWKVFEANIYELEFK